MPLGAFRVVEPKSLEGPTEEWRWIDHRNLRKSMARDRCVTLISESTLVETGLDDGD